MDIILKTSYIIFIISFSSLILLFSFYEPQKLNLEETEELEENEYFQIKAKVIDVSESPGMVFLEIEQTINKKASVFKDGNTNFSQIKGKKIIIKGHINKYKDTKSILADDISVIS